MADKTTSRTDAPRLHGYQTRRPGRLLAQYRPRLPAQGRQRLQHRAAGLAARRQDRVPRDHRTRRTARRARSHAVARKAPATVRGGAGDEPRDAPRQARASSSRSRASTTRTRCSPPRSATASARRSAAIRTTRIATTPPRWSRTRIAAGARCASAAPWCPLSCSEGSSDGPRHEHREDPGAQRRVPDDDDRRQGPPHRRRQRPAPGRQSHGDPARRDVLGVYRRERPAQEHDFGNFSLAERKFFFKIDYYDFEMGFGSEDPSIRPKQPAS